jgi:hypothetical protein
MPKMQELLRKHGYKVTPLTKEDMAEDLARLTAERADSTKTEPPSAPIEEEDEEAPASAPTLSLEELAALGDQN